MKEIRVKDFGKIGVLAGGPSNEREISLESGKAVFNALKEIGADAVFLDVKNKLTEDEVRRFDIDIAFIALHGRFGEDGTIQRILEDLDLPYTGSGPLASRLSMDKIASREIFMKAGLDVPRYVIAKRPDLSAVALAKAEGTTKPALPARLPDGQAGRQSQEITSVDFVTLAMTSGIKFPLVVKPQLEGSSIGVSIVKGKKGLREAIDTAFTYGDKIIVEEYIKGRELTVGILDNEPLPVIEILVGEQFYNFKAKYKRADTQYIVPAKISLKNYRDAQLKGKLAHIALGCKFFSRVDMILDEKQNKLFVLEVNSIPGLTSHSLLPKAASSIGIGFGELCLKIVESAIAKKSNIKMTMQNLKR